MLNKLSKPLKGIGPATASLLLAVHDPQNVVFFSDELYTWLVADGKKTTIKYTTSEFEELFAKAKAFRDKIKCSPQDLEKVAFVMVKEKEATGSPQGRPRKPERETKAKVPSGLPRGRPRKPDSEKVKKPTGTARGRPMKSNGVAPKGKAPRAPKADSGEPTKRGRPAKTASEGAMTKVEGGEEPTTTGTSKKRKEAPASAENSGKKAKV